MAATMRFGVKPLTPAEIKRILALKGTMSTVAAAEASSRSQTAIRRIWSGAQWTRPSDSRPRSRLSPRNSLIIGALEAAGDAGVGMTALADVLKRGGFSSDPDSARSILGHINNRLKLLGDPRKIVGFRGDNGYAYRLQLRAPVVPAGPAPISVSTEPNPNVTVGLHGVSLRRVRCLDGAPV